MAIFRVEKDKNYTVMSNYHLRDKDLSLKAKGLLSYMLSLPEDWDYSVNGLVAISKEGIKSIRSILKELEQRKYLVREKHRNESGLFEYQYCIYEYPYSPFGRMDQGHTEKDIQINTNKQSTKEINTKDKLDKNNINNLNEIIDEMESAGELNHPLTDELINLKYIKDDETNINEYNKLFKDLSERGCTYNSLLNSVYYIAPKVVAREFIDENGNEIKDKFKYFKTSVELNNKKLKEINKRMESKKGFWEDYEI